MGINIIIPFIDESNWGNQELIYCLRSIDKYCLDLNEIVIIGDYVPNLKNVRHILIDNPYESKSKNIAMKIWVYAMNNLNNNFCVFNDDYFLTQPIKLSTYPHIYKNNLETESRLASKAYKEYVDNTLKTLTELNYPTKNFDTHKPIIYNPHVFCPMYNQFYLRTDNKLLIRSTYCNINLIQGVYKEDLKINSNNSVRELNEIIGSTNMFSIGNGALVHRFEQVCSVKEWLKNEFPNKSKFEM